MPGADTEIILNWAKGFIAETEDVRANSQHILLILDGYSAHIQFYLLQMLRKNRITIALPAHTSHRLQTLDVSVFSPHKSFIQSEMHRASRALLTNEKFTLNAFDVALIIYNAYSRSRVGPNIKDGFVR